MSDSSSSLHLQTSEDESNNSPIIQKKISISGQAVESQNHIQTQQIEPVAQQQETIVQSRNETLAQIEQAKINPQTTQQHRQQKQRQTIQQIPQQIIQVHETSAKAHYDQQASKMQNKDTRITSRIIELRNFQNWVKAALINEYSGIVKQQLSSNKNLLNILEMGCGRGGDLKKWQMSGAGFWFGLDISGESLKEVLHRQQSDKNNRIPKIYLMQASANMDSTIFRARLPQDVYFDFASMQFMANLLFSSLQEVEYMLENITTRLARNGLVLMTITDAAVLVKKIRELGEYVDGAYIYGNKYFSIKFDNLDFKEPWGLKYSFYLEDSVGSKEGNDITYVPEFLISLTHFKQKALEYNLDVIEDLNFTEFYQKYGGKYQNLIHKIIKPQTNNWYFQSTINYFFLQKKRKMPDDQWEIVHLYRVLVMKHTRGQEQSRIRRHPNLQDLPAETLQLDK